MASASVRRNGGRKADNRETEMFSETVAGAGSGAHGKFQEIISIFMRMGCRGLFPGASFPSAAPAMQQILRKKRALEFHLVESIFKHMI